jgi:hypothetical protein
MSAEFPVTNGGLAEAMFAVHNAAMSEGHARTYNGSAATPMDVACIVAASFSALAAHLQESNHGHPQTVCPIPNNADMAGAMQLVGYDYLKRKAPERLHQDIVGVPRAFLSELVECYSELINNDSDKRRIIGNTGLRDRLLMFMNVDEQGG